MNSRSLALSADPAGSEVERPVLGQAGNGKGHSVKGQRDLNAGGHEI